MITVFLSSSWYAVQAASLAARCPPRQKYTVLSSFESRRPVLQSSYR